MSVYFESEINRRSANEDSFCAMEIRMNHEAAVNALVVADGMGGLSGGKFYSETAVSLWYEALLRKVMGGEFRDCSLKQQIEVLEEFSGEILTLLNETLYQRGLDAGIKGGTTLSAAIHFWDTWIISNCGDSPVYGITSGRIELYSDIQNMAEHMVREGTAREGTALYYQNKNRLTQYLGRRERVVPYVRRISDDQADGVLLGSDGAFGDLTARQIWKAVSGGGDRQDSIRNLFETARENGEEDNQTAILYVKDREPRPAMSVESVSVGMEPSPCQNIFQNSEFIPDALVKVEGEEVPTFRERFRRMRKAGGKEE